MHSYRLGELNLVLLIYVRINKSLLYLELMSLKRSVSKRADKRAPGRSKQSSALISRFTPGLAFAFSKETSNMSVLQHTININIITVVL